jgi:signal transduction histidine kinase
MIGSSCQSESIVSLVKRSTAALTYPGGMTAEVRAGPGSASRRSLVFDVLLAAGLAAFITVGTYFASHEQPTRRPFDALAVALLLVAAGALAWRRRYPVAVLGVVFGAVLAYFVLGYAGGPVWLALIVAYVTAVLAGHRRAAAIVAVAGFLTLPWLDYLLRDRPAPSAVGIAGLAAWLLVLLGVSEAVRIRRERAAEALRIQEEEARRRAGEERLRIARELHDALGHHLSLINLQSGVALHLNTELPEQARSSLTAIKQASKEALTELRSVLDILRQEGEPASRSPTWTLARLDDLVSQAAAAGLVVKTETDGEVRPLPFAVDVAAFRIVQEALTNVTRHAGPATATVQVSYGDQDLSVQVDDDGRGASPPGTAPGGGKGILGMRERVAALGGELQAGPRPGGGFRVRARLPLDGAP